MKTGEGPMQAPELLSVIITIFPAKECQELKLNCFLYDAEQKLDNLYERWEVKISFVYVIG